jgi:hypothetical protein
MVEKLPGAELDIAAQKSTLMGTYLEPELYVLAYRAAKAEGRTNSGWLRKLIVNELVKQGKLDGELLLRLAVAQTG